MKPSYVLLNIYQGQTFADVVTLQEDDGTPIDLSAMTARMQIREYFDGPLVMELTTENGRIDLDNLGHIQFHVTAADTAALGVYREFPYEQYVYDLELVHLDGLEEVVDKPIFGNVVLYKEITVPVV